jgi:hypothetical protein
VERSWVGQGGTRNWSRTMVRPDQVCAGCGFRADGRSAAHLNTFEWPTAEGRPQPVANALARKFTWADAQELVTTLSTPKQNHKGACKHCLLQAGLYSSIFADQGWSSLPEQGTSPAAAHLSCLDQAPVPNLEAEADDLAASSASGNSSADERAAKVPRLLQGGRPARPARGACLLCGEVVTRGAAEVYDWALLGCHKEHWMCTGCIGGQLLESLPHDYCCPVNFPLKPNSPVHIFPLALNSPPPLCPFVLSSPLRRPAVLFSAPFCPPCNVLVLTAHCFFLIGFFLFLL